MRRILFLVILALAATACGPTTGDTANKPTNTAAANTAKPVDAAAIETEIKKLVSDTAAALAKNDVAALEKAYADNYMLVNLDGSVQNRADRLASFRSGDTKFESFAYDEVSVRSNSEGTGAIVIARATASGTNKGRKIDGTVRVTQVWRKFPDGWKQVTGHATQITAGSTSPPGTNTSGSNTSPAADSNSNR
jgi:ketosteroid isomerase-like protein